MASIKTYTAPVEKLLPSDLAYTANIQLGRRLSAFSTEQAAAIKAGGALDSQNILSTRKSDVALMDFLNPPVPKAGRASGGGGGGGGSMGKPQQEAARAGNALGQVLAAASAPPGPDPWAYGNGDPKATDRWITSPRVPFDPLNPKAQPYALQRSPDNSGVGPYQSVTVDQLNAPPGFNETNNAPGNGWFSAAGPNNPSIDPYNQVGRTPPYNGGPNAPSDYTGVYPGDTPGYAGQPGSQPNTMATVMDFIGSLASGPGAENTGPGF
jgi:hypothetical protein